VMTDDRQSHRHVSLAGSRDLWPSALSREPPSCPTRRRPSPSRSKSRP